MNKISKEISKLEYAYNILPVQIASAVQKISPDRKKSLEEIRMRNNRPLSVTIKGKSFFLSDDGMLDSTDINSVVVTPSQTEYVYLKSFRNSLHSFGKEITKGSVVTEGGNRVGFCGRAILDSRKNYSVENVKNISSVNIRIARELIGCSEDFFYRYFSQDAKSVLVAGTVSSGKTTFLRDMTRMLGQTHKVSLIDEHNEISAGTENETGFDVGLLTDVFSGYNKYEGIMTAVKYMSPEYIVCDEIGGEEDMRALEYCINSGVKLCATCHAGSIDEAVKRKSIKSLLEKNAFDIIIFLGKGENVGKPAHIKILEHD